MSLLDKILGRPLASSEAEEQKIGVLAGVPTLGLDGLSSAAYGPEAALTILLPLGAIGLAYVGPLTLIILALLAVLYFSYRQTIAAYPNGGGSYTVAKENLGEKAGILAAASPRFKPQRRARCRCPHRRLEHADGKGAALRHEAVAGRDCCACAPRGRR